MTSVTLLAELHVREFVARQNRLDELEREDCARRGMNCGQAGGSRSDWRRAAIADAGPLGLLDAVGQAEESWVELFERAPRCDLPDAERTGERAAPARYLKPKLA
ncbi:MAG: hypothetical protein LJE61_10270 [Thiocapsa sp.]|jgi:hypothetical protein|nr:hypothetical protein [Thiocapsa sp.]MCG6898213.1 hypothetical protein [Thiocapsa sp.]MCG6985563.1 hypothetical protein [Thiocapsa sp.]